MDHAPRPARPRRPGDRLCKWACCARILAALSASAGACAVHATQPAPAAHAATATASKPAVTLQALVNAAVTGHPLARAAAQEVAAANVDVDAARRHWWPAASVVMESHSTSPNSPAARGLQLEQTLWDGGQLNANIDRALADASKSEARILWQRQQLALQVIGAWQALISARDKVAVARETIALLHGYEAQIRRRVAADASPAVDVELALSRLRQTEVDLAAARSSLRLAAQRLEQLTGLPALDEDADALPHWPDPATVKAVAARLHAQDLATLARDSAAVQMARSDVAAMQAQLEAKHAQRWPTAYLRVNKPLGDSYPGAGTDRGTSVFVGIRYTPGAGFATGIEADAINERVAAAGQSVEAAWLEQREAMYGDVDQYLSAQRQLTALQSAVAGSRHVLDSYSRQFTAGRKSWIDLLNAVRELAQNQYAAADSQAALAASIYRLQVRLGETELQP
ncbi:MULTISPECIES: TolC family protein [Achromobacter]|uniref:TolC family protein n=1 Tax=Achromobacter TaxID=222 RepID=UPI00146640FF|nr:TolC family protein [Achromobacter pulmonis]CAB3638178.1 hypothetical protein LMG26696_01854 [Achromobacter pulmonis]